MLNSEVTIIDVIAKGNAEKDITELDRLSFTVRRIDYLCAVVPAESFKNTPTGELVKNVSFNGIKTGQFTLQSFRHFRDIPEPLKIRKRVENEKEINFLDTLEHDVPSGTWSLKIDDSKLNVSFYRIKYFSKGFRPSCALQAGQGS